MKLGKKLLSCILAVLMIMSSVTVSFTVFAAAGTKDVIDAIDQYYDDLMEAINTGDTKRVPNPAKSANMTVAVDTYTSAWYYVTRAWYEYALGQTGSTYSTLYTNLVAEASARAGGAGIPLKDYQAILSYYNCPTGKVNIKIGTGYDVLAWNTAEDMAADKNRNYHDATFTINWSNGIASGSYNDNGTPKGITGDGGNIDLLSDAIKRTRDSFVNWFAMDFSTMSTDDLIALANPTDPNSCGTALTNFNNAVITCTSEAINDLSAEEKAAAIWDHYIKPSTGYSYSEAQEWMKNDLMANLYRAYAAAYKQEFDGLMAVNLTEKKNETYTDSEGNEQTKSVYVMTAEQVLAHYNAVKAKMYEIENKVSPIDATLNIFDEINEHFNNEYSNYYDKTVKDYVYKLEETLAKRYVVGPYDSGEDPWADQLTALLAEEPTVPTYDHSDEEAIKAWQGDTESQNKAKDFIKRATTLLTNIDNYITNYVQFDDIRYTKDGGVKSALSPVQKQNIDADRYALLVAAIDKHKLDVDGYETFMIKAQMDALMKTTILDGRRTGDMTAYYVQFEALVGKAKAKKNSANATDQAIYNEVFPSKTDDEGNVTDGLAVYEAYLTTIKERVARRIYEQVNLVIKYAGEGSTNHSTKAVRYSNYEAIIKAFDAIESTQASLDSFIDGAITKFKTKDGTEVTIATLKALWNEASGYATTARNYASAFRTAINNFSVGSSTRDEALLQNLLGSTGSISGYKWASAINKLNYDDIVSFVGEIGLVNKTINSATIRSLMDAAVTDFDKILVSEDVGTLLNELMAKADENGSVVKGLGNWEYDYTDANGVTHKKGTEIKTLAEFLVNMIRKVLFGGMLQDIFFKTVTPLLGDAIMGMTDELGGVMYAGFSLSDIAKQILITQPAQWWVQGSGTFDGDYDLRWYKALNGSYGLGSYPMAINTMKTAGVWERSGNVLTGRTLVSFFGETARDNWQSSGLSSSHKSSIAGLKVVDWSNWDTKEAWHITNEDTFYKSLAASSFGLSTVLTALITGETQTVKGQIIGINLNVDIIPTGDSLYDRLFVPLYKMLGISQRSSSNPNGFYSVADLRATTDTQMDGKLTYLTGYGIPFWKAIFEPLFYWMNNTLFKKPVETILNLLPNLLGMLEYDQIVPKLKNISIDLKAIGIKVYSLNVWDMVGPMLEKMGLADALSGGTDGILSLLIKATSTTSAPADDSAAESYLMRKPEKYDDGTTETVKKTKANAAKYVYKDPKTGKTTTYYFNNLGLLTQTLYNAFGDALIEWFWTDTTGAKIPLSNNNTQSVPVSIPVNRFLSVGTPVYSEFAGFKRTVKTWHMNVDAGDTLLTLFRWLLNDGTLYVVKGLIDGLMTPDPETGKTTMDTLLPILDGQADNILAILVCLLNEYKIDFTPYTDTVATNLSSFKDKNNVDTLLNAKNSDGKWMSKFTWGYYLTKTLGSANEGNDANLAEKADLAVENADKVVTSLIPMVMNLLVPALEKTFPQAVEKYNQGKLDTVEDIAMEIVVSNEFINWFMTLLVGDHEYIEKTDENGDPVLDASGNPILTDEIDTGLLGGLLAGDGSGTDTITKILNLLAKLDIDITPNGFYTVVKSGTFANAELATWFETCLEKAYHNVKAADGTVTKVKVTKMEDMTWGDMYVPKNMKWINYADKDSYRTRLQNFVSMIQSFMAPLNPLLSLLLCGEDITLADELVIQGNDGYGKAIVPIMEALGLDSATKTQTEFNKSVFGGESNPNSIKAGKRFATMSTSPFAALTEPLTNLLIGSSDGTQKGLLQAPIQVLFEKLPNIAYFMYTYAKDENGNNVSDFSKAVQNLIAPVLQLLDIADPVLSRAINLDIRGLLNKYLDMETLLNDLLSAILDRDYSSLTDINKKNAQYIQMDILDFGAIAAESSTYAYSAPTNRTFANGTQGGTWTKFKASPGQLLVTLVRQLLSAQMVERIGDIIKKVLSANGFQTEEDVASRERNMTIVENIVDKVNQVIAGGGRKVDVITGIVIDLLTDYKVDSKNYYFYEIMNKVDSSLTDAMAETAWNEHGIEHKGYDWASTEDKFTKTDVEDAIENIDYVIQKAVPDVLAALVEEGMLELPIDYDYTSGNGLWKLLQSVINKNLFTDDMINLLVNLLSKLFGTMSNIDVILNLIKGAGFDVTVSRFIWKDWCEGYKSGGKTAKCASATPHIAHPMASSGTTTAKGYITYGFNPDTLHYDTETGKLYAKLTADMAATLAAQDEEPEKVTVNGDADYVELTWDQVYYNHSYIAYEFDEDGNLVLEGGKPKLLTEKTKDENGNEVDKTVPVYAEDGKTVLRQKTVYVRNQYTSEYHQKTNAAGKYIYEYKNADGEMTEVALDYPYQLKKYEVTVDGEAKLYDITPVLDKDAAARWGWGLDTITAPESVKDKTQYVFSAKKNHFIDGIWEMLTPLAPALAMLTADVGLKLFDGGLNIEGNNGYENVLVPLLNALGLDAILDYVNTTMNADGKTFRDEMNAGKAADEMIPDRLLTGEQFHNTVVNENTGELKPEGMKEGTKIYINYIFNFVEILATHPLATLATALPTLSYFIYGDGLTTLLSNILIPITTLTDRIGSKNMTRVVNGETVHEEILDIDLNGIGSGLIDMLATGSWKNFQNALLQYVWIVGEEDDLKNFIKGFNVDTNDDGVLDAFRYNGIDYKAGEIVMASVNVLSLTQSLYKFIGSLEFDLSGILAPADERETLTEEEKKTKYSFGICYFLDQTKEREAKAKVNAAAQEGITEEEKNELLRQARELRASVLKEFFKSVAALGDEHEIRTSSAGKKLVAIDEKGQVKVSRSEILMFL
ncbi:MAG: hypothetical protein J6D79_03950, partial [Clostridia bacterium]|nr:hypothetical protein [Clostridia bacterium]